MSFLNGNKKAAGLIFRNALIGGILGALAARKVKKTTLGKLFVFCLSLRVYLLSIKEF